MAWRVYTTVYPDASVEHFFCGEDSYTGKSFEHRKSWVEARLELLSEAFAIQVCAFAVMSNHLHVCSSEQGRTGWRVGRMRTQPNGGFPFFLNEKTPKGRPLPASPAEIKALCKSEPGVDVIRERLVSVSWFMRSLNENIARRANREGRVQRPLLGRPVQMPGSPGRVGFINLHDLC